MLGKQWAGNEKLSLACALRQLETNKDCCEHGSSSNNHEGKDKMHNQVPEQPLAKLKQMRKISPLNRARDLLLKGGNLRGAGTQDVEESLCNRVRSPLKMICNSHSLQYFQCNVVCDSQKRKREKVADQSASNTPVARYALPELMVVHPLHWNFWKSLSVYVAVSWMFESMLKVGELGDSLCNTNLYSRQGGRRPLADESGPKYWLHVPSFVAFWQEG